MATSRVAAVEESLEHLPGDGSSPAQLRSLGAWFAARRGDVKSERRALQRLITDDPAHVAALDRLSELATREGKRTDIAELSRKKTEIGHLQVRYQKLYRRTQPARDAAEMAHIASQLGQRFEAKAFLTVAVFVDPDRVGLLKDPSIQPPTERVEEGSGRTLADSVAAELAVTEAAVE